MPRASLCAWVRVGTGQLASSLAGYGNGDKWRTYLKLDEVGETLSLDSGALLDEASQQELSEILQRFEQLAADERFVAVRRLPGFGATRSSLQELLRAYEGDERERLARSAKALNLALDEVTKGNDWHNYLALPRQTAAVEKNEDDGAEPDLALFEKLLSRFETVQKDPKYRVIVELPEFHATRENLASFIQSIAKPPESTSVTGD